jgi:hypothetical protein
VGKQASEFSHVSVGHGFDVSWLGESISTSVKVEMRVGSDHTLLIVSTWEKKRNVARFFLERQ